MGRRRKGCCLSIKNKCLDFDMFGSSVQFNVDGRNKWNTCCGALVSVVIIAVAVLFGLYQFRVATSGSYVPVIQAQTIESFYDENDSLKQEVDNWQVAIAVSSFEDFTEQNTTRFQDLGNEFIMRYQIFGETAVQNIFEIEMEPCEDYSIFNLGEKNSLSARNEETI